MNNNLKILSAVIAASAAGVISFTLANAEFSAGLPLDNVLAAVVSIALVGFAVYDYSRRAQLMASRAPVLRPMLPAAARDHSCNRRLAA